MRLVPTGIKSGMGWGLPLLTALTITSAAMGQQRVLVDRLIHLRIDGPREWTEFPETQESRHLELKFSATENTSPYTLRLRQQDVKQAWRVSLGTKRIGQLTRDENDMVVYFPIPAGTLTDGENTLRIEQARGGNPEPDDIRVGHMAIDSRPIQEVLSDGAVEIEVVDADQGQHLPSRITVLDANGALQTVGARSDHHLAVRPGLVYTADGKATFGLPAGKYTVYAGRGFEYSLASVTFDLATGQTVRKRLTIRREVPTDGYVACDTHVHTVTHSGHGDATVDERMITLAAEGIELPIATDHNVHIDHDPFARKMRVRQYFTPVIGNEVTTRVAHFNIFPVEAGAPIPDYKSTDWTEILAGIHRTPGVRVAILNHARDVHGGTRPFGPKLHLAVVGENQKGWDRRANGMEVVNSSATQHDVRQLFHDWMGLLNRGRMITPVGSSDSHDVGRHFVGQGRTYIRCDDRDPGRINVDEAVDSFLAGRVMVSYGLLVEMTVDGKHRSGALAPVSESTVDVALRVLGPHWVRASRVELYANGQKIREAAIKESESRSRPRGVKWEGRWRLPKPRHDVHLVAIAIGPGIDEPYWKTAKPYQRISPDWQAHVAGCSGAIWLDVDGDGRRTSAYDYARRLVEPSGDDLSDLIRRLADYDEAVAAQAAHQYRTQGGSLESLTSQELVKKATTKTRAGFQSYLGAWRRSQRARGAP